jgi:molecular chaperone DnaJ
MWHNLTNHPAHQRTPAEEPEKSDAKPGSKTKDDEEKKPSGSDQG